MKTIFSFLFLSALLTNSVYASMGESDTECIQMQEANERSNPKADLEQIKEVKPAASSAVRG